MARVIQDFIKKPLSEELLFGELTVGGSVKVKVKNKVLEFEYISGVPSDRAKSKNKNPNQFIV